MQHEQRKSSRATGVEVHVLTTSDQPVYVTTDPAAASMLLDGIHTSGDKRWSVKTTVIDDPYTLAQAADRATQRLAMEAPPIVREATEATVPKIATVPDADPRLELSREVRQARLVGRVLHVEERETRARARELASTVETLIARGEWSASRDLMERLWTLIEEGESRHARAMQALNEQLDAQAQACSDSIHESMAKAG